MGIRTIGDNGRAAIGIQQSKRTISVGTGNVTPVQYRPVASEHTVIAAGNIDGSDGDGQAASFDPASYTGDSGGDSSSGDAPRTKRKYTKRGNNSERRARESTANTSKTTNSLASLLCMMHGVVSNIVKVPALNISLDQSRELTTAILEVTEQYDVPLPTEKVAAWMNLSAVAYKVYIVGEKSKPVLVPRQRPEETDIPEFMKTVN
jgi:hypothetical protein